MRSTRIDRTRGSGTATRRGPSATHVTPLEPRYRFLAVLGAIAMLATAGPAAANTPERGDETMPPNEGPCRPLKGQP
jgi:hypothetical protein